MRCASLPAALCIALVAAGCGGRSGVVMSSGSPAAGGVPGIGTVSISGQPNSTVSAVIAIGLLTGAVYGSAAPPGAQRFVYRANPLDAIQPSSPAAPALDASRTVNEQDCSKPIENWSANLRCR